MILLKFRLLDIVVNNISLDHSTLKKYTRFTF